MINKVTLSYVLILLEEICNGYDNQAYRMRAFFPLMHMEFESANVELWKNHLLPTCDIIELVEKALMNEA